MRLAGKQKLGYFPLSLAEAERIRCFLRFPISGCAALDPCIGDGGAFHVIAGDQQAIRYGIELDAYRVEQARAVAHHVIHGDALDVHCPVESLSLLYLNPPYDFECGEWQNRRLEQIFFEHCYRWLKPAGVLVLVVPGDRLSVCGRVLAFHFKNKRAYRLGAAEATKYKQVVLFGVRRTRRECDQLPDAELSGAQSLIAEMSRKWEQLPVLPDCPDVVYSIPGSGPIELTHRGLPLDEIEDLLPKSAAYRQAAKLLVVCRPEIKGRPLTPLHGGHVALCAVAGLLDGVFGYGEDRHIAAWRSVKVTDSSEEVEEDGTIIRRERERFTNELTLLFASGKTAILR
jgi:SAM-dependent methyltransferase